MKKICINGYIYPEIFLKNLFSKIHISEMLPESFMEKFIKLAQSQLTRWTARSYTR